MGFGGSKKGGDNFGCYHDKDYKQADARDKNCSDTRDDKASVIDNAQDDVCGFVFWNSGIFAANRKVKEVKAKLSQEEIAQVD